MRVLILLVVFYGALFILWTLLSPLFKPVGKGTKKYIKEVKENLKDE